MIKKSFMFYSKNFDKKDYNDFKNFAEHVRYNKNIISQIVHRDRAFMLAIYNGQISKNKFVTIIYNFLKLGIKRYKLKEVDSVTLQQLIRHVYVCYSNMLEQIIKYKFKKKDDSLKQQSLRFLVRIAKSDINSTRKKLKYLKSLKSKLNSEMLDFCLSNLEELFKIVEVERLKILKKSKLIKFKSLSFNSINVMGKITDFTFIKKKGNLFNIQIQLPNLGRLKFETKVNHNYHGFVEEYKHSHRPWIDKKSGMQKISHSLLNYTVKFLSNGNLKFIFIKEFPDEEIKQFNPENLPEIGGDVNTKHNAIQLSDGKLFKFPSKIIQKERHLQHQLNKRDINIRKNKNQRKPYGKKFRLMEDKQEGRRIAGVKFLSNEVKKYCKLKGYTHLVLEDLYLNTKAKHSKKNKKFNQKNLEKCMHINDIKNILFKTFRKEGLQVSLVNPKYTSQTCPKCGSTCKKNRKIQEVFQCKECGFTKNADLVSSINILFRILIPELRDELEYWDSNESRFLGKEIYNKKKYEEFVKLVLPNISKEIKQIYGLI